MFLQDERSRFCLFLFKIYASDTQPFYMYVIPCKAYLQKHGWSNFMRTW